MTVSACGHVLPAQRIWCSASANCEIRELWWRTVGVESGAADGNPARWEVPAERRYGEVEGLGVRR